MIRAWTFRDAPQELRELHNIDKTHAESAWVMQVPAELCDAAESHLRALQLPTLAVFRYELTDGTKVFIGRNARLQLDCVCDP